MPFGVNPFVSPAGALIRAVGFDVAAVLANDAGLGTPAARAINTHSAATRSKRVQYMSVNLLSNESLLLIEPLFPRTALVVTLSRNT